MSTRPKMVPLRALLAALPLGIGCAQPRVFHESRIPIEHDGYVVTLPDLYQAGRERVLEFAASGFWPSDGMALDELIARGGAACVRVERRVSGDEFRWEGAMGSGARVGRYVLTAGHIAEGAGDLWVGLADGSKHTARLIASRWDTHQGEDWAVLEVEGDVEPAGRSLAIGDLRQGEVGLVLGFPGGNFGFDESGRVICTPEFWRDPVAPMGVVLRLVRKSGHEFVLEPVAGFLPEMGMSGSPVLNAKGDIVGITAKIESDSSGAVFATIATDLRSARPILEQAASTRTR